MMSKSGGNLKPFEGNVTSGCEKTGPLGVFVVTGSKSQECWEQFQKRIELCMPSTVTLL